MPSYTLYEGALVSTEDSVRYPVAQLLDELRAEDAGTRAQAVRSLGQIAAALGPLAPPDACGAPEQLW